VLGPSKTLTRWWRAAASACCGGGIEVEIATNLAAEAAKLNEPFLHFRRPRRPLVTLQGRP